jgi:hypothetical protein
MSIGRQAPRPVWECAAEANSTRVRPRGTFEANGVRGANRASLSGPGTNSRSAVPGASQGPLRQTYVRVPLGVVDAADLAWLMAPEAPLPSLLEFFERPAWQAQAACRGTGPAIFFAGRGDSEARAVAMCAGCPVRVQLCGGWSGGGRWRVGWHPGLGSPEGAAPPRRGVSGGDP